MVSGDEEQLQKLGNIFKRFAEETYIGSSPLYATLSNGIAEDIDVLDIASSARGRPVPNNCRFSFHDFENQVHPKVILEAVPTWSVCFSQTPKQPSPSFRRRACPVLRYGAGIQRAREESPASPSPRPCAATR